MRPKYSIHKVITRGHFSLLTSSLHSLNYAGRDRWRRKPTFTTDSNLLVSVRKNLLLSSIEGRQANTVE